MNRTTLHVELLEPAGELLVVRVLPIDFMAMEDEFGISARQFEADTKARWVYWLGWHAIYRSAPIARPSFEHWIANVAGVELVSQEAAAPFLEAPPDAL